MPIIRRRLLCFVPLSGPDEYASIKFTAVAPRTVDFLDRTFHRTNGKTAGGWLIYREKQDASDAKHNSD